MNNNGNIDLILFNKYFSTDNIKIKDLIHLQTPVLANEALFLLVEINKIMSIKQIEGIILGTEGFYRGNSETVFRKIYSGDFAEFDIKGIMSGTIITFLPEYIKELL